jgi:iron complex outermembrane recepter protein
MTFRESLILGLLVGAHAPALAQDAPSGGGAEAPAAESGDLADADSAIIVTGTRLRGAVDIDVDPLLLLDPEDIAVYGAGTLAELIDMLEPHTASGRGRGRERPIVLLNGRRISGFSAIAGMPPEAVERVEVLPEEVAIQYGYSGDRRVVNIVLRENFRSVTVGAEGGMATAGGRDRQKVEATLVRIAGTGLLNVEANYERQSALFESERNLIPLSAAGLFDLTGNIGATTPGDEIDPALSALAGAPVTVAGVPRTAGPLRIEDFLAGANAPNVTDLGRHRTLLPGSEQWSINGTYSRTVLGGVQAMANARFGESSSMSRFGLPAATFLIPEGNPFSPFAADILLHRSFDVPRPLTRESQSRTARLALNLNGDLAPWRWTFTAAYDHARSESHTDTGLLTAEAQGRIDAGDPALDPFARDLVLAASPGNITSSTNRSANAELIAMGPVLALPAGPVRATVRLGADTRDFESRIERAQGVQGRSFSRSQANAQANVMLPIASRRNAVLDMIGDLAVDANVAIEHVSDFGVLTKLGSTLSWSPITQLQLRASISDERGAPSVQQLGDPLTIVPNVRVFDFVRGETVDIDRVEGGNPALLADRRRVVSIDGSIRPIAERALSIQASYTHSRLTNLISSFPVATPEIEAAFPDRFVRDSEGRLLSVDSRPVNLSRAEREQLRWGVNFMTSLGEAPAPTRPAGPPGRDRPGEGPAQREGAPSGRGAPPVVLAGGSPMPGSFRPGADGRARLQLSVFHTWRLRDEMLIRPGVPPIDYLDGATSGAQRGRSVHEVQARAALLRNGTGANLSATWRSGSVIRTGSDLDADTAGRLFFSDFASVDMRLFANLDQQSLIRPPGWLRGTRITLSVDNLFDSRPRVRDETGQTPLGYQPAYLDPLGRTFMIGLRKLFS